MNSKIKLTTDQDRAYKEIIDFLVDPAKYVHVLSGYSGTGKSTLVRLILDDFDKITKMMQVVTNRYEPEVILTATTNKAAESLQTISGRPTGTIFNALGLIVKKNYQTGVTNVIPKRNAEKLQDKIIFIDEASFANAALLKTIFKQTERCKILFIGDPAQLVDFKSSNAVVFESGYSESLLEEVVRQSNRNSQIIDVSTNFRNAINGAPVQGFKPNGTDITVMDRQDFNDAVTAEFARPDWVSGDSRFLAYTNKTVIKYNEWIANHLTGTSDIRVDDYVVNNNFVVTHAGSISTDQLVHVTQISSPEILHNVPGKFFELNESHRVFVPDSLIDKKDLINYCRKNDDFHTLAEIENTWADLRHEFASTINKSQGSTYKKVFIDLDDVKRCNIQHQLLRLLYVSFSRASEQVILTGDLV
jgi:exodeoxyribonuclease-5